MGLPKAQGAQRPTALGTMLQAATYGATIPTIFGMVKSPLLAIWAANLRQAGSGKKGKKKGKKGPPTYAENIDFLIGSNPIVQLMQIWRNQSDTFPLNFTKYRAVGGGSSNSTVTVPDAQFYAVVGVTAEYTISRTFTDYGAPSSTIFTNVVQEFPLWNAANHGPDLVNPDAMLLWPYFFKWKPADGATILFPIVIPVNPFANYSSNGFINIYYAQLSSAIQNQSPAARLRLAFESQLGNNASVYAPVPAQQITYPQYAGMGSTNLDLGAAGAIPSLRPEVIGSYPFYSSGDAEFADMIEDIFKSGIIQTGAAMGLVHRGVNCNSLPGPVQKDYFTDTAVATALLHYWQPNQAGSILIAANKWSTGGSGAPTISDGAGNTWVSLQAGVQKNIWYVNGCLGTTTPNAVTFLPNITGNDPEAFLLEIDPGFTAIDVTNSSTGTTPGIGYGSISLSITTTGPAYIVGIFMTSGVFGTGFSWSPHWTNLFPFLLGGFGVQAGTAALVVGRYVSSAGTYTLTVNVVQSGFNFVMGLIALKAPQPVKYPKALGNILDVNSLYQVRLQCRAGGLQGSLSMDSQKAAADWLKDIYMAADAAPVWSGFALKSIPRSEVSTLGQAAIYNSPTSTGPVANLTESDLIGDEKTPLITVERKAQVDALNILQVQHFNRADKYNPATVSQPESGAIALYGPRKQSPIVLNMVMDPAVARKILAIEVRRNVYLRNLYKFKAHAKWLTLEAMDLITITDSKVGINTLPVRLTKIVENDKLELEMEAEPFIYGVHSPDALAVTTTAPYNPNVGITPANVNTPIFLEPVARLISSSPQGTTQTQQQLWIVVSDSDPAYGGCVVEMSTDGGNSYNPIGQILGNAITGFTVGDWPAATDPDTTNDLSLDLTESLGVLASYQVADEDAFTYPCYAAGGAGAIPYELMTYAVATLTATYKYTLKATGGGTNHLRRAVFSAPTPGAGVDHPNNTRWAFLNPIGVGIFKLNLDPRWIGTTLHFKFLAFNTFQEGIEDLSSAMDYTYTPTGVAQAQSPNAFNYTVTGGALTNPTSTTIDMAQATAHFPTGDANYNARVFTIPAPSVPTIYYVTIADPTFLGDTGTGTNLTATCQISNALVGVAGNTYIGSIVALPAAGGMVTGGGGLPVSPITFKSVPLAPSVGGNFTVAHGGSTVPKYVVIQMTSAAEIWFQNPTMYDATNLYLVASDGGITAVAQVFF